MDAKISPDSIGVLSETMLITLWAKAVENRRGSGALLRDAEAERMMGEIDYDFDRFAGARASQAGVCGRAALMDGVARRFVKTCPDAVVVQLGAGLDARYERLGRPAVTAWYDLDLPEVIALRRMLLPESGNIYIGASMFDEGWAETVAAHGRPVLVLIEGVLMYFGEKEVKALFAMMGRRLAGAQVVFDAVPPLVLGRAKRHDALKRMDGVSELELKWSLKDFREMESWQQGLRVLDQTGLSGICGARYPLLMRLVYKTAWGRRNLDQRIVQVAL